MARPKHATTNMSTLAEGVTACARALDRVPLVMRPHVIEMLHKQTTLDLAIVREQIRQQQAHQAAAVPPAAEVEVVPDPVTDLPCTDAGDVAVAVDA